MTFENLGLSGNVLDAINDLGFKKPSEIQEKAIPILLSDNKDFVGLAQTGTGKTAAFGLPLVDTIDFFNKDTQGLVICPTRELCLQITRDLQDFAKYDSKSNIVPVYGGSSIEVQIRSIKKGAQIIVATPGRLVDLIRRKAIKLHTVSTVVLDEADEMLNMGFKEDIDSILEQTPMGKRTWLFSATMPKEVRRIAKNYMSDPQEVTVGKQNSSAANIEHQYFMVREKDRYAALKRMLDYYPGIFGLIFCRTKRETGNVSDKLEKDGYSVVALHGDLSQAQRDAAMKKFRERTVRILVATDVAARGIDVDEVSHVIHYNLPDDVENYTHRSGRTARAGRSGMSLILINTRETSKIRQIENKIGATITQKPVPNPDDVCEKQMMALIDKVVETEVNEKEIEKYIPIISEKLQDLTAEEIIKKFVSVEFNKFLAYYSNAGNLNSAKGEKETHDRGNKKNNNRRSDRRRNEDMKRFFMNLGKKQNMNPGALVRLVCDSCGLESKNIGPIDIKGNFAFFEVDSDKASKVLNGLKNGVYEGQKLFVEAAESANSGGKGKGRRKPVKKVRKAKRKRN